MEFSAAVAGKVKRAESFVDRGGSMDGAPECNELVIVKCWR